MTFNIEEHLPLLTSLRQQLHAIAEVSGLESNTAQTIKSFLIERAEPDQLQEKVGGHGILATYGEHAEGPHILLRCELDALPIVDDIDAEYRSKTQGTGHKCGHDGHMAILCGVAMLLADESLPKGKVSLLFQPAEETGEGAKQVIEDQQFNPSQFDYCFALHNLPGFPKHQIVVREGTFAAASVGLEIELKGQSAHSAHPEEGRSPAVAMAQLIQSLSTVPQYDSPMDGAVKVTVINAEMGERSFGILPSKATVRATLRTYNDDLLASLQERCLGIAEGLAHTYGLSIDHHWVEPFSATSNNAQAVDIVRETAKKKELEVLEKENPFSWSEDFGRFTKEIPGAMFGLGIGAEHPALHAERYDFPDDIIPTGTLMFIQIIKEMLS